MDVNELHRRFAYHAPDDDRRERHERVRTQCETLAVVIEKLVPEGREKSLALTKIEEAMMWGNAGIAREPKPEAKRERK